MKNKVVLLSILMVVSGRCVGRRFGSEGGLTQQQEAQYNEWASTPARIQAQKQAQEKAQEKAQEQAQREAWLKNRVIPTNNSEDLLTAALNNDLQGVETLLGKGASVNSIDTTSGYTALMYASLYYYPDMVKMLLTVKGIDVNVANEAGYTALMYASLYDYPNIVAMLLTVKGIDVNVVNETGYTALMYASLRGYQDIVTMLENAGAK